MPAILRVLEQILEYARERDYTGWDYGDGMSSRIWRRLPIDSKWFNLAFQEVIKRAPVNIRPLLLVEQRRNFMGAALFAMANQNVDGVYSLLEEDAAVDYRSETRQLLDWLIENRSRDYSGFALGHQHDIQDLQGYAEAKTPDSVVTSFGVKALLRGATYDSSYAETAKTAARFVTEDLNYRELDDGTAKLTYSENHPEAYYTLNAGALGGRLFVDLYAYFGEERFRERARRILDHIVVRQEPCGGWQYRDPPSASHLSMDTHHNGFIVECLQRYQAVTGETRYSNAIDRALRFHRQELFESNGAPKFDYQNAYPRDIHASAQGILVFTYADDLAFAGRILDWTLNHLYAGDGRFYYRKNRFYTKRITLMRWCQAWMAYAMSEYLSVTLTE